MTSEGRSKAAQPDPPDGDDINAAVSGYAADVITPPGALIAAVDRFEDGNRHAVFKVSYLDPAGATKAVVVRVSSSAGPDERAQAGWEARVLRAVGGLAGPLLYDFRITSRWFAMPAMCMAFVPGHHRALNSVRPADIERLGSLLGWLHGRPVDELAEYSTTSNIAGYAQDRIRSIRAGLAWVRDPLPVPIQARLKEAARSLGTGPGGRRGGATFSAGETLALLHGDPGPGNILWGPSPVLIDWEYARLGDPADEIAYLFDQNGLTSAQRDAFWRGYQTRSDSPSRVESTVDRVAWWEPVTLLGSTLWWAERCVRRHEADAADRVDPATPREQSYYTRRVVERLDRLDRLTTRDA